MYQVIAVGETWSAVPEADALPEGARVVFRHTTQEGAKEVLWMRNASMSAFGCPGNCDACPAGVKNMQLIGAHFGGEAVLPDGEPQPTEGDQFWNAIAALLGEL